MFNKLVLVDHCGLTLLEVEELANFSKHRLAIYNDYPTSETVIIERIGDADGVLVSWHTKITATVLASCPSLRYIGMCCSLYDEQSANVDILKAKALGITVKGVRDYGDEGTVEFIFAQLIYLFKGLGDKKWKAEPTELKGKHMGIVGLGALGKMVARTALHFGMKVSYYNRSRKPDMEAEGVDYMNLDELVSACHIISTHLPKNTVLLGNEEFARMKTDAVLINTSLGPTFDQHAFQKWISSNKHVFAIFDGNGSGDLHELEVHPNIVLTNEYSGFTQEARKRLSQKVLKNIEDYFGFKLP